MSNILRRFINNVLTEGKIEDLQAQYPNLNIKKISERDPSRSNKYLAWMVKQLSLGVKEADLYPTISLFHNQQQRLEKRDIYQYSSLKELEDTLKDLGQSKRSKRKKIKSEGAEKIYENKEYDLYFISSKNACIEYGKETRWCITMKDAFYWEQYSEDGYIFYFAIRKDPKGNRLDKVAFAVNDGEIEIFDADDAQIDWITRIRDLREPIVNDSKKRPMPFEWRVRFDKLSNEEIDYILNSKNDRLLKDLAGNEILSKENLIRIANSENESLRYSIASNPKAPVEALMKIVDDSDPNVRAKIALNQNSTSSILAKLANDIDYAVRIYTARHKNTPDKALEKLSNDKDDAVRIEVAKNPKTSGKILIKLAKDFHYHVKLAIAKNLNSPKEALFILSSNLSEKIRGEVARNLNTSKETLIKLATDPKWSVRAEVALNSNTPRKTLIELSYDKIPNVREYVADNKNTPIEILKKLINDVDRNVRWYANKTLEYKGS